MPPRRLGSEAYGAEHSWNYEGGVKTLWFADRLSVNGALFYLKWDDLQVNVPNPFVPLQFFIANAAGATSKGADLELNLRLMPGCDFFGGLGYTNARFEDGSVSDGVDVSGNRLANTPNYTANFGGQYSLAVTTATSLFARAEVVVRGSYEYDDANTQGQDAYSIATSAAASGQASVCGSVDSQRVRHAICAYRVRISRPGAFRLCRRDRRPRMFGIRAGVTF